MSVSVSVSVSVCACLVPVSALDCRHERHTSSGLYFRINRKTLSTCYGMVAALCLLASVALVELVEYFLYFLYLLIHQS